MTEFEPGDIGHAHLYALYGKLAQSQSELLPATSGPENNFDWQTQTKLDIKNTLDTVRELVYTDFDVEEHSVKLAMRALDDVQRYMEQAVTFARPIGE